MNFGGPSLASRVQLFRELATLVDAGMSLGQSLTTLAERPSEATQALALRDCARSVTHGERFSQAMSRHPRIFTAMNQALIAAGEEGGQLDDMLNASADYLEKELAFQQMVARETFYPKILLAAVILIPLGTRVLIAGISSSTADAVKVLFHSLMWYVLLALPIVALWYLYQHYRQTDKGRLFIDTIKLRLPLIGPITSRLAWSKVCRSLAALYKAGVNIGKAVRLAGRTSGNEVIRQSLERAIPLFEQGKPIAESLAATGYVPSLAMSMLRTGEQTGDIDLVMDKVGDYFEAEAESSLKKLTVAIVPIAIIIFGIVVLMQMAQAYGGYFSQITDAGK